jgi:hypothetical protein
VGSSDCDPLRPVEKSCAQVSCLTANEKGLFKSGESRGQKELIEEQEQRKNKRRKATWGYSIAEQAKSCRTVN